MLTPSEHCWIEVYKSMILKKDNHGIGYDSPTCAEWADKAVARFEKRFPEAKLDKFRRKIFENSAIEHLNSNTTPSTPNS